MKSLTVTIALCLFASFTFGQIKRPVINDSSIFPVQPLLMQERILGKSPYGTIYALPQDNMPVVAADSNLVKQMPNGFSKPMFRTMPNPIYPYRRFKPVIIPDSLKGKSFVIPVPKEKPKKN
jgi:hypothetical protein